jgi:hypothetical protein
MLTQGALATVPAASEARTIPHVSIFTIEKFSQLVEPESAVLSAAHQFSMAPVANAPASFSLAPFSQSPGCDRTSALRG